jgi:formylglycine-generating enzyme required for sulfatase activity
LPELFQVWTVVVIKRSDDVSENSKSSKSDIFISYKREEHAEAEKLAKALESQGWSVWWDPKLRAGERYDDVIGLALKNARCVIVLWSELSVESEYVRDEAAYALKYKKIVPVALKENLDLPFRFTELHTPRLIGWDGFHDAVPFQNLLEDIILIIGSAPIEVSDIPANAKNRQDQNEQPDSATKLGATVVTAFPAAATDGSAFRDRLKDGTMGPEMVPIPAGTFTMGDVWGDGDSDEKPTRQVRLSRSISLGKYAVTFDEYDLFAKATGRTLPNANWGRVRQPVINVSWDDAVAYCQWLSQQTGQRYRLPTEAEWEYAARSGGKKEKWAGTSDEARLGEYAWYYDGNSGSKSHFVGEKQPNGLGLYDMSGNVWEWCRDWFGPYSREQVADPVGPESGSDRVVRGGGWGIPAWFCRSAYRDRCGPDFRDDFIGFRLARGQQAQENR